MSKKKKPAKKKAPPKPKPVWYCPYSLESRQAASGEDGQILPNACACPAIDFGCISPRIDASGSKRPGGILVVGEAPGGTEDQMGECFVGASGKELRAALTAADIDLSDVTFTNTVRCRPPGNKTPGARITNLCVNHYLWDEIAALQPRVIFAVGRMALKALAGTALSIMRYTALEIPAIQIKKRVLPPVVASVHPAWVLRNRRAHAHYLTASCAKLAEVYEREKTGMTLPDLPALDVLLVLHEGQVPEALARMDAMCAQPEGCYVSFDVETNGLNPWLKKPPRLLCLSLSSDSNSAVVIPIDHSENTLPLHCRENLMEKAREVLTTSHLIKVGHNVKFDNKWIRETCGWEPYSPERIGAMPGFIDTMLLHTMTHPESPHKLNDLTRRYGITKYGEYWLEVERVAKDNAAAARKKEKRRKTKEEENQEKEGRVDYSRVPLTLLGMYNGYDTMVPLHVLPTLLEDIHKTNGFPCFRDILMPASRVLQEMESYGLKVDEPTLVNLTADYTTKLLDIRAQMDQVPELVDYETKTGKKVLMTSPKQKAVLLYDHWQLKPFRRTDSGQGSTDKESLEHLLHSNDTPDYARRTLEFIQEFMEAHKFYSTYLKALPSWRGTDGLVHGTFRVAGTRTGRISCARPNLQNVPRDTRPVYRTRFDDGLLIGADYSQLEARVCACFCKDPTLLHIFQTGKDLHIMSAAIMFDRDPGNAIKAGPNKDWGTVTKEERPTAKSAISFGVLYGRRARALAEQMHIPIDQAEAMRTAFFNHMPTLVDWIASVVRWVSRTGYIETAFGRRRPLPDIWADDWFLKSEAERKAVNSPIQGTAGEMTILSLVKIHDALKAGGYRAVPIVTVHDSIVVDTPRDEARDVARLMVNIMEDVRDYPWAIVPFPVELKAGERWCD